MRDWGRDGGEKCQQSGLKGGFIAARNSRVLAKPGENRENFFFLPLLGEGCWQSIFPRSVNFVPEMLQTFGQGKVQNKPINVLVRDRDQGKRKQGKKDAIG